MSGPGAWAMLRRSRGRTWKVDGGALHREFFFRDITPADASAYADHERYLFIFCPEGVRIGATVRLTDDGLGIVWPPEDG